MLRKKSGEVGDIEEIVGFGGFGNCEKVILGGGYILSR